MEGLFCSKRKSRVKYLAQGCTNAKREPLKTTLFDGEMQVAQGWAILLRRWAILLRNKESPEESGLSVNHAGGDVFQMHAGLTYKHST